MDQQESLKDYFDIALDDIKMKEGSDSIFIVSGNIDQKIELDDNWKVNRTSNILIEAITMSKRCHFFDISCST